MRAALLALSLAACAAQAPPADAPANHLAGTEWRRVDDENANPHGATMTFSAHGASGYTGCNTWFASVMQDGEALRFRDVRTTRMACGAGVQTATEQSFLAVLRRTRAPIAARSASPETTSGRSPGTRRRVARPDPLRASMLTSSRRSPSKPARARASCIARRVMSSVHSGSSSCTSSTIERR